MVGRTGFEPVTNGLTYHYSFHYQIALFVVWTIPSPQWGVCRLVSTPSRCRAWLGIAILQGSPNLTDSTSSIAAGALLFSLKSAALPAELTSHTFYYTVFRPCCQWQLEYPAAVDSQQQDQNCDFGSDQAHDLSSIRLQDPVLLFE